MVAASQSEMSAFKAVGSQLAVTAGKSGRDRLRGKLKTVCFSRRDQASQLSPDPVPGDGAEAGEGERQ